MVRYLIKKISYAFLVLISVIVLISSIIYLSPVDPAQLTFGQRQDIATVESKKKALGLDQPLYIQLALYLNDVSPISIHHNTPSNATKYNYLRLLPLGKKVLVLKVPHLRESFQSGKPVIHILKTAIPRTAILALTAIILALIVGVVLGVLAALNQNTWLDNLAVVVSVLGYSLPSYVTAMILGFVFAYYLGDYTHLNIKGGLTELNDMGDEVIVWKNLLLPTLALGIRPIGIITQLTRSAMLDVLKQDYIRTAKAKGLGKWTVNFRHALRNALNPVATATTGWFASLLAGAFFVEFVFSYNGLGLETINALKTYDLPVVLGTVIFVALAFSIINIVVDFLYVLLDPRIRLTTA